MIKLKLSSIISLNCTVESPEALLLKQVRITMNRNFKKPLPIVEGFVPIFSFNRITTVNGIEFLVSVIDKSGIIHHFTMQQGETRWKIVEVGKVADWIAQVEGELEKAIFENTIR